MVVILLHTSVNICRKILSTYEIRAECMHQPSLQFSYKLNHELKSQTQTQTITPQQIYGYICICLIILCVSMLPTLLLYKLGSLWPLTTYNDNFLYNALEPINVYYSVYLVRAQYLKSIKVFSLAVLLNKLT